MKAIPFALRNLKTEEEMKKKIGRTRKELSQVESFLLHLYRLMLYSLQIPSLSL